EVSSDGTVAPPLGDQRQDLELPRRELVESAVLAAPLYGEERLDDARVDDRPTGCDLMERPVELASVLEPLLEEVAPAVRALVEELGGVERLGVLAQDDHADLGTRRAELHGKTDPLVGVRRRHPDVGEHQVRKRLVDRAPQLVEVAAGRQEIDVLDPLERPNDPFPRDEAVLSEHDANRHAWRLTPTRGTLAGARKVLGENSLAEG